MNLLPARFLCLALIFFSSCADVRPIATGRYVSDKASDDEVSVLQSELIFHVRVANRLVDHKYNYTVLPDGRIHVFPMVSSDVLLGVGWYDWYWDGKTIIQQDPRTGESAKFQRR